MPMRCIFTTSNVELLQIPARKHIAKRAQINDNNSRTGWPLNVFPVAIKWRYNYEFSILFLRHGMTDEILVKLSFEVTIKFLFFFLLLLYNTISFVHWYDSLHGLLFISIIIICLLITIFCFCEDHLSCTIELMLLAQFYKSQCYELTVLIKSLA